MMELINSLQNSFAEMDALHKGLFVWAFLVSAYTLLLRLRTLPDEQSKLRAALQWALSLGSLMEVRYREAENHGETQVRDALKQIKVEASHTVTDPTNFHVFVRSSIDPAATQALRQSPQDVVKSVGATSRKMTGIIPLLLAVPFFNGCALFENTVIQDAALRNRSQYQSLTPDLAARTTLLQENISEELDESTSPPIIRRVISRTYGLPIIPKNSDFVAASKFADEKLALQTQTGVNGTDTSVNRSTSGRADTLEISAQAQVDRTDITATLLTNAIAEAAKAVTAIDMTRQVEHTKRENIRATRDIELAKLEPVEEEPEGPETPEVPEGIASPQPMPVQ